MKNLLLFLKVVMLSTVISGLIGGIIGNIVSMIVPEHAHQIMPTWLMAMMLGGTVGLIVSSIVSIFFVIKATLHAKQSIVIYSSVGVSMLVVIGIAIWLL